MTIWPAAYPRVADLLGNNRCKCHNQPMTIISGSSSKAVCNPLSIPHGMPISRRQIHHQGQQQQPGSVQSAAMPLADQCPSGTSTLQLQLSRGKTLMQPL